MQKQKESPTILSLHQEIEREVQEIEKEMARHPELDEIQVTEEMDRAFWAKVHAFEKEREEKRRAAEKAENDFTELRDESVVDEESDEPGDSGMDEAAGGFGKDEKKRGIKDADVEFSEELVPDLGRVVDFGKSGKIIGYAGDAVGDRGKGKEREREVVGEDGGEKGKVVYRRKKRKYFIVSLVAVIGIVLGVGVNSVGSKSYWKMLWDRLLGTQPVKIMNVEDMEKQETEDGNELNAYREIKEKLNIKPVRPIYKPGDMKLVDYEIYEEILTAQLLYKYNNEIIRYILYVGDVDSSWGEKEEDMIVDEYTISVNEVEIRVEEFEKPQYLEKRQLANFEYQGVHYQLKGVMNRREFEEILKNLYFF